MHDDFMTQDKEAAQGDSVFLRYASGWRLLIEPNIRETVAGILEDLEAAQDGEAFLRSKVQRTTYGGSLDTKKESTWIAATLELFERFRKYSNDTVLNPRTRTVLTEVIKKLSEGTEGVLWDEVKQIIKNNIDALSPIPEYRIELDGNRLIRDEEGYYFIDENGTRVNVTGMATAPEQALQFYTSDIQEAYGRLYYLLRYIALFEIAYQYKVNKSDFPQNLSCTLFDNGGETGYLRWQWQRPVPFEYVGYNWFPRSPYSNPDWLGSDLIMALDLPGAEPSQPRLQFPPTDEVFEKWRDSTRGAVCQLELPVESNLIISTEPEVYLDFLGKTIRWINGNLFLYPIVVVPASRQDGEDAIEVARKFLSVINYEHTVELVEKYISIQRVSYRPTIRQPRITSFQLVRPEHVFMEDFSAFSKQKWYALAFLREASNSSSIFYSYLNYYKIIELVKNNDCISWINENAEVICREKGLDWYEAVIRPIPNKKAGAQLAGTMRNAVAHGSYRRGGNVTHNPDNPTDYNATLRDLPAIKALAEKIVEDLA